MDVYLVPTGRDRYELYCEAPVSESEAALPDAGRVPRADHDPSIGARLRRRWVTLRDRISEAFTRAVEEGEQHRLGVALDEPPSRVRRAITRRLADAVAEQRLLWFLRRQDHARLFHPDDLSPASALDVSRRLLALDRDKHQRWLIIDGLLSVAATPVALLPGPNVLAYYFVFRTVGHYLSMKGASKGLSTIAWASAPTPHLTELGGALALDPLARDAQLERVSQALGLDRLRLFVARVADRPS